MNHLVKCSRNHPDDGVETRYGYFELGNIPAGWEVVETPRMDSPNFDFRTLEEFVEGNYWHEPETAIGDIRKFLHHQKQNAAQAGMYRVDSASEGVLVVGKFRLIRQSEKSTWIQDSSTGEGGSFNEEKLGKVLEQFYIDNF